VRANRWWSRRDYAHLETTAHQRAVKTFSLAFYDRRELIYFPVSDLPLPRMWEGERMVMVSPDP